VKKKKTILIQSFGAYIAATHSVIIPIKKLLCGQKKRMVEEINTYCCLVELMPYLNLNLMIRRLN